MNSLPVVETFRSIQGEGIHSGRSAFFIRLAGCNVACSWCDTKHSWPQSAHPRRSFAELSAETAAAAADGAAFVVITGGEPLHHNLDELCEILAVLGLPLHLETSGVDPLSGKFDWISLSPKRHKPPCNELLSCCDELKLVVHEAADLEFAESMAAANIAAVNQKSAALLLQPGADCPAGRDLAINYVLKHPNWRLSLQTHKWLGVQ